MAERKENSTNNVNRKCIVDGNDLSYAIAMVGGRWKLLILINLEKEKLRFSEIRKAMPNITERMLTLQLRELENDGLICRTVYAEVPPKVEYELTEIATELIPIWKKLCDWGARHRKTRV
ncbi:winged helix-turn-helix transcriptional regulator [Pedobacter steynii]|uniref:Transcriptional regulator n=1 Tax=Pedobacter steynii TaxID=430522 RepID=A0A1D7QKI7_9SPHI|nr:winged helix-turn-helix transcriptional regulator [Pedobacter steynii]AOM79123.1 transcriptional regulator [Pedobacter steynii]